MQARPQVGAGAGAFGDGPGPQHLAAQGGFREQRAHAGRPARRVLDSVAGRRGIRRELRRHRPGCRDRLARWFPPAASTFGPLHMRTAPFGDGLGALPCRS